MKKQLSKNKMNETIFKFENSRLMIIYLFSLIHIETN